MMHTVLLLSLVSIPPNPMGDPCQAHVDQVANGTTLAGFSTPLILGGIGTAIAAVMVASAEASSYSPNNGRPIGLAAVAVLELFTGGVLLKNSRKMVREGLIKNNRCRHDHRR